MTDELIISTSSKKLFLPGVSFFFKYDRDREVCLNVGKVLGGMSSINYCRAIHPSQRDIVNCILHLYFQAVIIFSCLVFHRKGSLHFALRKLNLLPTTAFIHLFSLQSQSSCLQVCKVEDSACFMSKWQWKTWYNPLQQQAFVGFSLDKLQLWDFWLCLVKVQQERFLSD